MSCVRSAGLGALGGFGKHTGAGLGARRGPLGVRTAALGALGGLSKHTGVGIGAGLGARRGPLLAEGALGRRDKFCEDCNGRCSGRIRQA